MRLLLAWLLAILALAGSPAHAAFPPRPTGPVLDQAGIIPAADEAALDAKLRAYNRQTGRAIIVATVTSLDGRVVERYAQDLARAWDIGGKESQEGVLFLVAPNERKVRIHTAVGAQGRLTDGFLGRTIREVVTPRFKAKDMTGGINAGVDAVIAQMNRDETDAVAVAEAAAAAEAQRSGGGDGVGVGSVIFWIVLLLFFLMLFGRRRRGYRRSGFGRGVGVWDVGEVAANIAINVALNAALGGNGGGGDGGGGGGGFGGFGGGGGGFDGGGASGDW